MYVIVDDRRLVIDGFVSSFKREGICMIGVDPKEFGGWIGAMDAKDALAIEAFLIGESAERLVLPALIRERSKAPILGLRENQSLDETLRLLTSGADDVLRKPVHPREILARVGAINRRKREEEDNVVVGELCIFFHGREPEIRGEALALPRRERRILEYIARNRGRRVTKSQIFNAVYGLFDECVDENVVESHVCKLRKKLKHHLGFDPIESQRFLGYLLPIAIREPGQSYKVHFEGALFYKRGGQKEVVGCRVAELTATSARIVLTQDTLLPVEQVALFESCNGNVYDCTISWRDGNELELALKGVLFHELHKEIMTNSLDRAFKDDGERKKRLALGA
jgi:two-component system, OmpR family, flagellar system response regulator FtcR